MTLVRARGAIAAGHPAEAEAGAWVLDQGGSAVDAVVAAAFVAAVVEPWNCGLGGYGHASVRLPGAGGFVSVDHGPRAPSAAGPSMFAPHEDTPAPGYLWPAAPDAVNESGGSAVAVPGAVAGLAALHRVGGRLPWARLLDPAVAAAGRPLEVSDRMAEAIARRSDVLARTGGDALFPAGAGQIELPD